MATGEDLERLRQSVAVLPPGQPSGLSREDAMALLADAQRARRELDRLITGLRKEVDGGQELTSAKRSP
jgi:hypothetical protein